MAIPEFFRQIGEEYLGKASGVKDREASQLFQEAAELSLEGRLEEASKKAARAQSLLQESSGFLERQKALLVQYAPEVATQLKERFNIEDPPLEFLRGVAERIVAPLMVKKAPRVDIEEVEKDEKQVALTHKQFLAARARLRLVDTEGEEIALDQAVGGVYQKELVKGVTLEIIKTRMYANWRETRKKLEAGFALLATPEGPARLPLTEEQLARFASSEETQDLYRRLSQVEAYQGLTLGELLELIHGSGPVRLKPKPEVKEGVNPHQFTTPETLFLAGQLLSEPGVILHEEDSRALEAIIRDLKEETKIEDPDLLKDGLVEKLRLFRENPEDFFPAQDKSGQLLLAMVADRSLEELQGLLI